MTSIPAVKSLADPPDVAGTPISHREEMRLALRCIKRRIASLRIMASFVLLIEESPWRQSCPYRPQAGF